MISMKSSEVIYPSSDGKPMADNTLQFQWITTIKGGFEVLFRDHPNVFVAGDLLWYPVQGEPKINVAPDVMVVFGRPKGHRPSYKQWEEDHIAPQVVFEILSQTNTLFEMIDKQDFYESYGVEEYYLYDPQTGYLKGWKLQGSVFRLITNISKGWISPLLNVRFEVLNNELVLTDSNGDRFLTYEELAYRAQIEQNRAEAANQRAIQAQERAEQTEHQLELERQRAEAERQRAEAERQRAEQAELQNQKLRELLRSQGIDLDQI